MTANDLLPKFRELFPEFSAEPDAKVLIYLELALGTFAKCTNATVYLAAHNLVMGNSAGIGSTGETVGNNQASLPLQSMGVDGKSASFMKITKDKDAQYSTTTYGLFFLQLKKACANYVLSLGNSGNSDFNYY